MLIHNITFSVETSVHEQWLAWMKTEFVPILMDSKLPSKHLIMKLLTEIDNGGETYSFQLHFKSMADYLLFEQQHKDKAFEMLQKKYNGKYLFFATLLEEIS